VRYELPMLVQRTAAGTQAGIGDMGISVIGLLTSGPRHAAIVLGGLTLDSASRPPLGAGKQQLTFGGARPAIRRLVLELGNALLGPRGDWYLLDLDVPIAFHADVARLVGSVEAGHLLVGRVGLFVRGGTQLLGPRQIDYFLDAGVRYLFKLP
jgi:hypothetical protein